MAKRRSRTTEKKLAQIAHSITRARERYGLHLTEEGVRRVAKKVRLGQAVFMFRQSLSRTVFAVAVEECLCVVVYDAERKSIRTFLPPLAPGQTFEDYAEQSERFFPRSHGDDSASDRLYC